MAVVHLSPRCHEGLPFSGDLFLEPTSLRKYEHAFPRQPAETDLLITGGHLCTEISAPELSQGSDQG